ncbi:MAG: hypothetical protein LBE78_12260 [Burkholderiaceae bacterium]|jgi:hypothetical protein|nr:hypothetical protein [Burkholderiaceae bacterium]
MLREIVKYPVQTEDCGGIVIIDGVFDFSTGKNGASMPGKSSQVISLVRLISIVSISAPDQCGFLLRRSRYVCLPRMGIQSWTGRKIENSPLVFKSQYGDQ